MQLKPTHIWKYLFAIYLSIFVSFYMYATYSAQENTENMSELDKKVKNEV